VADAMREDVRKRKTFHRQDAKSAKGTEDEKKRQQIEQIVELVADAMREVNEPSGDGLLGSGSFLLSRS
jgi:hypothetical protein